MLVLKILGIMICVFIGIKIIYFSVPLITIVLSLIIVLIDRIIQEIRNLKKWIFNHKED